MTPPVQHFDSDIDPAHHRDESAPCEHCNARWVPDGTALVIEHDAFCYHMDPSDDDLAAADEEPVMLTFPMGAGRTVTVPGVGPVIVEIPAR